MEPSANNEQAQNPPSGDGGMTSSQNSPLGDGGLGFASVSTFVFDVDGVLTDGNLIILPGGVMARRMNIKDGYALQLAVKKNYQVVIISGGNSEEVKERLHLLGVKDVFMRVKDKKQCLEKYMTDNNIAREEVLFMGDDMPDYEVMQTVALACCPADAAHEIKDICHYISPKAGGRGCARDVIEKVLALHQNWLPDTHIKSQ